MRVTTILFSFFLLAACNKENNAATLNGTDEDFLQRMSYADHNEISEGQIADSLGTVDSVKIFAQIAVTGYSNAQVNLDSIASQLQVKLPLAADSSRVLFDMQLQTLSGINFDTTYISQEVLDHQLLMILFNDEISYGNNPQLKNFANEFLPMVEQNFAMVQRLQHNIH